MAALHRSAAAGKGKEGLIVYEGGRLRSRAGWRGALLLLLIGAGALGLALGVAAAPPTPDKAGPDLPRGNRVPWQAGSYYLTGVNYPFYGSYGADLATLKSRDSSCNWTEYNAFDYAAI